MRTKQKIKSTLTLPEIIMYGLCCGQRAVCLLCWLSLCPPLFERGSFCDEGRLVLFFQAVYESKAV